MGVNENYDCVCLLLLLRRVAAVLRVRVRIVTPVLRVGVEGLRVCGLADERLRLRRLLAQRLGLRVYALQLSLRHVPGSTKKVGPMREETMILFRV